MRRTFFSRLGAPLKKFLEPIPIGTIAFYFFTSRLLIILLAAFSIQVIRPGQFEHSAHLIDTFVRWDAGWYLNIAQEGYNYSNGHPSSSGFAPLYPLLIYIGHFIFRDFRISAYFVSNACLFASAVVLWKLVERDYGNRKVADLAVLFLLICPVSFFFSTIYTESLFFLLFVSVAYLAAGNRWLAAGFFGYLMTLSRLVGIFVVFLLAAEYAATLLARAWKGNWRSQLALELKESGFRFIASVLMTLLGLGTFSFYLWRKFGDPAAFQTAQSFWGRHFVVPWHFFNYDSVKHEPFFTLWFDEAVVLGFVLLVAGLIMRIRLSHSLIAAVYLTLYLSTNSLEAMPRYLSVLFPFYITLALVSVRWPRLEPMLLAGSAMLLMLSTILFADGYWFT